MPEEAEASPSQPAEARRSRYLRRAARVAMALFVGAILLMAVALIAARVYLTEDRTRALAEAIVNEVLAGTFSIESVQWDMFPQALTLRGVEVRAPDGTLVVTLAEASLRIDLRPLLWQEVRLTEISVKGAEVFMHGDADGFDLVDAVVPTDFDPDAPEDDETPRWVIRLDDVSIDALDLVFVYEDFRIDATGFRLERGSMRLDLPRVENVLEGVSAERIVMTLGERVFDVSSVSVREARYERSDNPEDAAFTVTAGALSLGRATVTLDGRMLGLSENVPWGTQGTARAQVDLADPAVRSLLPEALTSLLAPQGHVGLQATVGGTMVEPEVVATARGRDLVVMEIPIKQVGFAVNYDAGRVTLTRGRVDFAAGSIDLSGRWDLVRSKWSVDAQLRDLPIPTLARKWVDPRWLPARVTGRVSGAGHGRSSFAGVLEVDLNFAGRGAEVPAGVPDAFRVAGKVRVGPKYVRLDPLEFTADGVAVRVSGRLPLSTEAAMGLEVDVTLAQPTRILAAYDLGVRLGPVRIVGEVGGRYDSPTANGVVTLRKVEVPSVPPFEATVPFEFVAGAVDLKGASVRIAGGRITIDAKVKVLDADWTVLDPVEVAGSVQGEGLGLGSVTGGALQGQVRFFARVDGPVDQWIGRGHLFADGVAYRGVTLDRAELRVSLRGTLIEADRITLRPTEGGTVQATARLDYRTATLTASVAGAELPFAILEPILETSLEGEVGFEFDFEGEVTAPSIEGQLALVSVVVDGYPLGTFAGSVSGDLERLRFDTSLHSPGGEISVVGAYSMADERLDVRLMTDGVALGRVLTPVGDTAPAPFDAVLRMDIRVNGTLPIPDAAGRIRLTDVTIAGERLEGGDIVARVTPLGENEGLRVRVSALGTIDAVAQLRRGEPVDLVVEGRAHRLSFARLLPSLNTYDTNLSVSGDFAASWKGQGMQGLTASVTFDQFDAEVGDRTLSASRPVRLHFRDGVLSVDDLLLSGPEGQLSIRGTVGETLALESIGRIDVGLVGPLIPALARISGIIDLDLRATGSLEKPVLEGRVVLAGPIELRPRTMVREVRLNTGTIIFAPGVVRIEGLRGDIESGSFTAQGELAMEGLSPGRYKATLTGENLPLRTAEMTIEANTTVTVEGTGGTAKVSGVIDIVRGRYLQKFELKKFNFRAQRSDIDEPLAQKYPWLADIALDIVATSTGEMEVKANAGPFSLELGLDTNVTVTGTAADPIIEGQVRANRGQIDFPKARLEVVRAVIDFHPLPGQGIHPTLDLLAEGEVIPPPTGVDYSSQTYFVTIGLEGDPQGEMPLLLSSDPSLSELEILSLLTTGRVNPNPDGGKGDVAMAFASSALAEPLTRFLTHQLEKTLNFDVQIGAEFTSVGFTARASTEITRRLRIEGSFQRTSDLQSIAVGRARYLLSDRIFLEYTGESVAGSGGSAQVGSRNRLELKLRLFGD